MRPNTGETFLRVAMQSLYAEKVHLSTGEGSRLRAAVSTPTTAHLDIDHSKQSYDMPLLVRQAPPHHPNLLFVRVARSDPEYISCL